MPQDQRATLVQTHAKHGVQYQLLDYLWAEPGQLSRSCIDDVVSDTCSLLSCLLELY